MLNNGSSESDDSEFEAISRRTRGQDKTVSNELEKKKKTTHDTSDSSKTTDDTGKMKKPSSSSSSEDENENEMVLVPTGK